MDTIRLNKITDSYFPQFKEIYSISFPIFEQRTDEQHLYALSQDKYHLDCYVENDIFIGFIIYWSFDSYIYIEHFAIDPNHRGKNYGSLFLKDLIEKSGVPIILEIDPIVDDISTRRYNFYKALGFEKNEHQHTHPAYREGYTDHNLVILSTGETISNELYKQFYSDLKGVVMNKVPNNSSMRVV